MEKLTAAMRFGGFLSQESIAKALSKCRLRYLKAGEHFLPFGRISNEIAFVESGILRIYALDDQGNEVTKYFVRENQFTTDLESYYANAPSQNAIQAVLNAQVYTIHKDAINALVQEVPNYFLFLKSLIEVQLLNKIKDNDFLNFGDAKTKYLEFLNRYPELALNVPQVHIASYLKITPQSLSRIRKALAKP